MIGLLLVGTLVFYPRVRYSIFPKLAMQKIQTTTSARDYWMTRDLTTYGYSTFTALPSTHYASNLLFADDLILPPSAATMAGRLTRLYDNKEALRANGYYFENRTSSDSIWLSKLTWQ